MTRAVELSGVENAAVMVMLLQEEQASRLLAQMEPEELRQIGQKMCELGEIGPEIIAAAIIGFVDRMEQYGLSAHGRVKHVRKLMSGAVGELRADHLMMAIEPEKPGSVPALELAHWLMPDVIAQLIGAEHPQAIAVLLVQLDPEVAAKVMHKLPESTQAEIVHRIATLGPVAPSAIALLNDLLARRIEECHGQSVLKIGGPKEAAEIINNAVKSFEQRVMPEITKRDKMLARAIESEMFKFEHLYALDGQSIGALLREVESEMLVDALKGIPEEERAPFFGAMSSRAADGIKDLIADRSRLKKEEVVAAQRAIVGIARRLASEGAIVFGGGDDDYV